MMKRMKMTGTKNKKVMVATAITTLLSATAAVVAIKKAKKNDTVKSEFEIVLDDLVENGTITQEQQVAIQSAMTTAMENSTENNELTTEENVEVTTVPGSSVTGTFTRLTNSLFKGNQNNNI